MLKINFEFRKGIFFIRLIGILNNNNYKEKENIIKKLIKYNQFKYVVINTNYLETVDLVGINCLLEVFDITKMNKCNLIICDKNNIFKRLLHNSIPIIKDEIEVL